MEFIISNQDGLLTLKGSIRLQGSKNAMLNNLVLPLLTGEPCIIENAPRIGDIETNLSILETFGARVAWNGDHSVKIDCGRLQNNSLSAGTSRLTTGSKFLIPIMTNRFGEYVTGPSGGDSIGDRNFLSYAQSLRPFGIDYKAIGSSRFIFFKSGSPVSDWSLPFPSFGLTINALLSAVSGQFAVRLSNACLEPEIDNTIDMLRQMGADIERRDRTIEIGRVRDLKGVRFRNMSDRNAAVTYAAMGVITGGGCAIDNFDDIKMDAFYGFLSEIGVDFDVSNRRLFINPVDSLLRPIQIKAFLYPEFHSDWQALVAPILAIANGESRIEERLFPDRLRYWDELGKMGASFQYDYSVSSRFKTFEPHAVRIQGPAKLHGARVYARDLRGGVALAIASLVARGDTVIENAQEIARGYEDLPDLLRSLGVSVEVHP